MEGWIWGVGLVLALYGGAYGWEVLKEKYRDRSDGIGTAIRGAEKVGEVTGSVGHSLVQRLVGLGSFLLGVAAVWILATDGPSLYALAGLGFLAYGVYLLWPGQRSFWFLG